MTDLTQLPSDVDISFVAGDTFNMRVRIIDPVSGDAVPLAGYLFCAEIGTQPIRSIVAQFEQNPDPGDPDHAVIMTLTKTETAALPGIGDGSLFRGVWDLEVTFPNGDVRTVASGSVECRIDVSHCAIVVTP